MSNRKTSHRFKSGRRWTWVRLWTCVAVATKVGSPACRRFMRWNVGLENPWIRELRQQRKSFNAFYNGNNVNFILSLLPQLPYSRSLLPHVPARGSTYTRGSPLLWLPPHEQPASFTFWTPTSLKTNFWNTLCIFDGFYKDKTKTNQSFYGWRSRHDTFWVEV